MNARNLEQTAPPPTEPQGRRKGLLVAAAAFAIVTVTVGVAALLTRPDASDGAETLAGERLPLTVEQLEGIWFEDRGTGFWQQPILARFAADGTFALGGVLDGDSWHSGAYTVEGQSITFTASGGACGSTDTFVWDVEIVAEGRFEGRNTGGDGNDPAQIGECSVPIGEPYNFTRISPTSPAAAFIIPGYLSLGDPRTSETTAVDVQGYWLDPESGYLLKWYRTGGYVLDDTGAMASTPEDAGQIEMGTSTLTFVTGRGAHGCAEGDTMVWEDVSVEDGRLQGVVSSDSCGRGLGAEVSLSFLGVDLP
jgi:hypothetical protein